MNNDDDTKKRIPKAILCHTNASNSQDEVHVVCLTSTLASSDKHKQQYGWMYRVELSQMLWLPPMQTRDGPKTKYSRIRETITNNKKCTDLRHVITKKRGHSLKPKYINDDPVLMDRESFRRCESMISPCRIQQYE